MTILTEGAHAGEFIVSEAMVGATGVSRSRDPITILSGQTLVAGAVLGAILAGATGVATAGATNTGDGVMGAITATSAAVVGDYVLTVIEPAVNAGSFSIENPNGVTIGTGNVAAAFSGGGISFTLADGAVDFVAGDSFIIAVVGTTAKFVEFDAAGSDGSQNAAGILFDAVDASAADATGVALVRDCEYHVGEVVWKTGADVDDIASGTAGLQAHGIISR